MIMIREKSDSLGAEAAFVFAEVVVVVVDILTMPNWPCNICWAMDENIQRQWMLIVCLSSVSLGSSTLADCWFRALPVTLSEVKLVGRKRI